MIGRCLAIVLFSTIFLLGLHYAGVVHWAFLEPSPDTVVWEAKPVPKVTWKKLDGSSFSIEDFAGKVVLLNFWASWCAPCLEEFPSFLKTIEEFDGKVVLVAVSTDREKKDVEAFLNFFKELHNADQNNHNIIIAWDPDFQVAKNPFGVIRFPETVILDPNLKMVKKVVGARDWNGEEMKGYLAGLL